MTISLEGFDTFHCGSPERGQMVFEPNSIASAIANEACAIAMSAGMLTAQLAHARAENERLLEQLSEAEAIANATDGIGCAIVAEERERCAAIAKASQAPEWMFNTTCWPKAGEAIAAEILAQPPLVTLGAGARAQLAELAALRERVQALESELANAAEALETERAEVSAATARAALAPPQGKHNHPEPLANPADGSDSSPSNKGTKPEPAVIAKSEAER